MAFTDPIISGEQLNRTGIKSDNYIPGVSGWRIATDGAAEFDNIGVRGNLWVPTITLNGQDLETQLDSAPKGLAAWMGGYPVVSTTSGAKLMETEVQVINGRWYDINLISITPDIANTKQCEFHIVYTTNETTPGTGSPILAISLRVSQFEMANVRAMWLANYTGRLRLAATIHSLDGATVRSWAPGAGCFLAVYDMGVGVPQNGSIGTGTVSKTLKDWTITTNSTKTYSGSGAQRTDGYYNQLIMGDWQNEYGNQRAWWTFSSGDVGTYINDLAGVLAADVVTAEVRLRPWKFGKNPDQTGHLSIGYHNMVDSLPNYEAGGGIPNVHRPAVYNSGADWWINILPGPAPSNFLDAMRDGYLKGFMVGNTFSGLDYAIMCEGMSSSAQRPQLHMQYWK